MAAAGSSAGSDGPVGDAAAARLRELRGGLARLAAAGTPGRMLAAVPREVCASCRFDRSMLSYLTEGRLRFGNASYDGDLEMAEDFLRLARAARPRLVDCAPEHEAATQKVAVIVPDARDATGVYRPLVHASWTTAYIVVPVVCFGVTVGLIHADRVDRGEPIEELDSQLLLTFATALGWAVQRFPKPLRREQAVLEAAVAGAAANDRPGEATTPGRGRERKLVAGSFRFDRMQAAGDDDRSPLGTLTARERDVLTLLADGSSNAWIARELFISEATVKSHVHHILTKLAVSSRTQAVARYHASWPQRTAAGEHAQHAEDLQDATS